MRSHAKASTAGSTQRHATGLGRIFRGADATRGASPDAKGSGAPARSHLPHLALAAAVFSALVALTASIALGATSPQYLKSFGPDGAEMSEFEGGEATAVDQESGAVYVGDRKKQTLYKFDSEGNPVNWGGSGANITGNEITGLSFGGVLENQAAVDSETHVVYITSGNAVRAFEANGEPHIFGEGPGATTSEISGATQLTGVAVDADGNIYASDSTTLFDPKTIRIYTRSGAPLTEFEPKGEHGPPTNLAVAPDGSLYIASYLNPTYKLEPSQFPVTPSTTYSVGVPLDEFASLSVAVDPTTSYVYVGQVYPRNSEQGRVAVYDEDGGLVGARGAEGEDGDLSGEPYDIAVNGGGERLYVADYLETGGTPRSKVRIFETFTFAVEAPTITGTSAIGVSSTAATLQAKINPNTLPSTYRFEYGLEDCAVSACTSVPVPDTSIGSGHVEVSVSQSISGLQVGATYHYRVGAKNSEGERKGPDRTFTTQLSGLGFELADDRAWEMVSPPNKNGGGLLFPSQGVTQAAADGSRVAYQSAGSIEADPEGNRAIDNATILSRRDAGGGWSSKDLTSPHTEVTPLRFGGEFKAFSSNLEKAVFEQMDSTLLSPEASEQTPYLRGNTEPPTYTPLVTGKEGFANVPLGTVFGGNSGGSGRNLITIGAGNASLTHVVLNSIPPLVAGAAPQGLYEWAAGQLHPVSELPEGEGGDVVFAEAGSGFGSVRHAVSEDGSRVFWGSDNYPFMEALYVRDIANEETGRLDVKQSGASGEGKENPAFQGASADGSVVFFSDQQQLTTDASAPEPGKKLYDLYRCEVAPVAGTLGCDSLTDISAPRPGSGERAEFLGTVPGLSEDGSRIYFVAGGKLDTTPNQANETAVPGQPNLYLWEEGQGRRFIATLSEGDKPDFGVTKAGSLRAAGQAARLSASSSPNGRYLSFMSQRSLTGYENADAISGETTEEVFRYDAQSDHLDCVSCNPSGASPAGSESASGGGRPTWTDPQGLWSQRWVAAILPDTTESEPSDGAALYRPRVVHDNGRVFFNAIDALVPADSNGQWDVYEYEPLGVGDCSASSGGASIVRSAGGCVTLISSGTAEEEAAFLDASEEGEDVFFLTPAQLSVADEDREADIYDARVNGIPAVFSPGAECLGEACQPPASAPNDPTPASAGFKGKGNLKSSPRRRCAKGKRAVRRNGKARCLAKKQKKHKRAARHGRASR